jgi:hypothetical protein
MLGHQIHDNEVENCPTHALHVTLLAALLRASTLTTRLAVDLRFPLMNDS